MNTKKTCKCEKVKRSLKEKSYKMKFILRITTQLLNHNVEEQEFSNDIDYSIFFKLSPTLNRSHLRFLPFRLNYMYKTKGNLKTIGTKLKGLQK